MSEELKAQIVEYLKKKGKSKTKDIAKGLGVKKKEVDTIVKEMAKAGEVEFLYIGTSYVQLVEK
ncbi:MAG: hypothetical protein H0Z39_01685 [Peptococcaceae bacterium]|nr:hypothetical protein [Peptococcaceae bacterium]